jgi:DNA modification methylase
MDDFMIDLKACGFEISSQIIWNKPNFCIGRSDYQWKHEPCLYVTRGNHNWRGGRNKTTVWDIPLTYQLKQEGSWGHGTQKPIECMKRPIENNSDPGDSVYDPFCGSGTTIIAAERTGRKCLACELNPVYCDAIIRRWEQETGERAIRESDGLAFDDLVS